MAAKSQTDHSYKLRKMWTTKIVYLSLFASAFATPPACFLSCINELAHYCPSGHSDLSCLCRLKDSLVGCLVDICPLGTLDSARDHFVGTCLEHHRSHDPPHVVLPPEAGDYQIEEPIAVESPKVEKKEPKEVLPEAKKRPSGLMKQGVLRGSRNDGSVVK